MKQGYVYIMTNKYNTTFYIGVTSNIERRVYEHKNNLVKGFTEKYNAHKLVYIEQYNLVTEAIAREKQLKNWHRDWKINLIKKQNPNFEDLYTRKISNAQEILEIPKQVRDDESGVQDYGLGISDGECVIWENECGVRDESLEIKGDCLELYENIVQLKIPKSIKQIAKDKK
ncbi:MAG: GIY-YIG nuclease family protein [Alphaproteobacteria bacterium]